MKSPFLKHFIFFLSFLSLSPIYCQIQFQNPSFEMGGNQATNWPFCNGTTDVEPGTFSQLAASDGNRYLGFWDGGGRAYAGVPVNLGEGTMQLLRQNGTACALVQGKTYTFELDIHNRSSYDPGAIAFVGGFNQCQPSALLWRSDMPTNGEAPVNANWQRYTISFVADQAYSWVGFYAISRAQCGLLGLTCGEGVYIDNLSTVTKVDGSIEVTDARCEEGGSIKYVPDAGFDGPFTYTWTDEFGNIIPFNGDELDDLDPGTYSLEVTDNSEDCPVPSFFTATITGTEPINGELILSDNEICEGETAQLGFNFNGNPSRNLIYDWTPTIGLSDPNIPNPIASITEETTYTLRISDANDPTCVLELDTTISIFLFDAGLSNTIDICESDEEVNLFDALGGTPDAGGTWTYPDGNSGSAMIDPSVALSGDYIYAVSENGCPEKTATITVNIDQIPDAGEDAEINRCNESTSIDLFSTLGGNPESGGQWSGPNNAGDFNAGNGTLNPFGASEGSYDFEYTVQSAGTCPNDVSVVTVNIEEKPIIEVLPIDPVCLGDEATVNYEFTAGEGPFSLLVNVNGVSEAFSNLTALGSFNITPAQGTAYTIRFLGADGSLSCSSDTSIDLNFPFNSAPVISLDSTFCDPTNVTYQVVATLSGGDAASYTINGNINVNNQNNFVSDPIPTGTAYDFAITDDNGCAPLSQISGTFSCDCATKVGTQNNSADTTIVCDGNNVGVLHNGDEFLDPDDVLSFILHTSSGTSQGMVLVHNSSGVFTFDAGAGMAFNTVYYISAVAGNEMDNSGLADLSNPDGCLEISRGQAVIFRENPSIAFQAIQTEACAGDMVVWEINTLSGSLPISVLDNNGNTFNFSTSPDNFTPTISSDTSFSFTNVTDAFGCSTNLTPPITLNASVLETIAVENYFITCNSTNTGFIAEFDVTGGDPSTYIIQNSNITGTLDANGHFVSDEISNGTTINLEVVDANACNVVNVVETGFCPCATESGAMEIPSTAPPLEFCIENIASAPISDMDNDNIADGFMPDANDVQSFILIENLADLPLQGPSFIAINNLPSFEFNPNTMSTNTVYYIVPVAGDDDGSGLVSFTEGCRDFEDGTPIIFNEPSTITFTVPQEVCESTDIPVTVNIVSTSTLNFTLIHDQGFSNSYAFGTGIHQIDVPNNQTGSLTFRIDSLNAPFEDNTNPTACRARWNSGPQSVDVIARPTAAFTPAFEETICLGESISKDVILTGSGDFDLNLISGESFSINGVSGTYQNAFNFSPSDSSVYQLQDVQITTALGLTCTGTVDNQLYQLHVNAIDNATINFGTGPICVNEDALLQINVLGDQPEYMLYLSDNDGNTIIQNTSNSVYSDNRANLQNTETFVLDSVFDATVSDASGNACVAYPNASATQVVNPLPTAQLSLAGAPVICQGETSAYRIDATGAFDIAVVVNDGASDSLIILGNNSREVVVAPTIPRAYSIISVTDANGCMATDFGGIAQIDVKVQPVIDVDLDKKDSCVALTVNITNQTAPEFLGSCLWDFGDGNTSNSCGNVVHTYQQAGEYQASYRVISPENCVSDTLINEIVAHPNPVANFDLSPKTATVLDPSIRFFNLTDLDVQSIWSINGMDYLDGNPILSIPDLPVAEEILARLYVETAFGCTDSTTRSFTISDVSTVYVPTAFSPNGDGINDRFFPVMTNVIPFQFSLMVYNRWGEMVYKSTDPNGAWDGTFKGALVQEGVYSWKLEYRTDLAIRKERVIGQVTVIR